MTPPPSPPGRTAARRTVGVALAATSTAAWAVAALGRGRFWAAPLLPTEACEPSDGWPSVVVIVPARDEAGVLPAGTRRGRGVHRTMPS